MVILAETSMPGVFGVNVHELIGACAVYGMGAKSSDRQQVPLEISAPVLVTFRRDKPATFSTTVTLGPLIPNEPH